MIWYLIGQRMHGKNWNRQRYCWMQDIIKIPQDRSLFIIFLPEFVRFLRKMGLISRNTQVSQRYFQKEYIKQGEFDKKYSKYLQAAFQIRNNCDYSDFFIVSREDAEEQYQHALEMLKLQFVSLFKKGNTEKYSNRIKMRK